ncbi:MAG: CTP synthase [Patescibacteria group bacterium]|nr:CTP synthase [Patescibacteria group bacterium]MDW8279658.1 CTP synthase [bacterium]
MPKNNTNFIFVIGGVMSGIGKGITVASTARILKDYGFKATAVKIDPYLNVDAGTMNPTEHGEVFVTEDGMECDQDIGNYERFLDQNILKDNYMTSGAVYREVINRERDLGYNGKCVQIIPHITDEIESRLINVANKNKADFVLVEIGGTAGEYENLLFLETARIMKLKMPGRILFMLVSYLPIPEKLGEMKTKPTQHAVRALNYAGIQPDIIIARSSRSLDQIRKKKISLFCNVVPEDVISAPDIDSIYEVPVNFEKDNLGKIILKKFGLKPKKNNFSEWQNLVKKIKAAKKIVKIGIVGKYFGIGDFTLADSYISVIEAIKHAAWHLNLKPEIHWLDAQSFEENSKKLNELKNYHGIIVPGGFGSRGVEGKILTIEYVRKHKIPYLGLCYGMQLAVIEFSRNVCGLHKAHTTEVNPKTPYPVISTLPEQTQRILNHKDLGGTMRLGAYVCELNINSKAFELYKSKLITERHRHRYEFNNEYRDILEKKGMIFSGINPDRNLVEIIELKNHPYFIGTQFHPEFKSRPLHPHPLFLGLVCAAKNRII